MTESLALSRPAAGRSSLRFDVPVDGHARQTALLAHDGIGEDSLGVLVREFTRVGIGVLHLPSGFDEGDVHAALAAVSVAHPRPFLAVGHGTAGATLLHSVLGASSIRAVALAGVPADDASVARLPGLRRPLLVLHSPTDVAVGVEHAGRLLEAARHPKSFLALDGADHTLSRPADAAYVGVATAAWALRYAPAADAAHEDAHHGHWAAARIGRDRFHTEILAGGHPVIADEPASLEGTNHGPTPYELVLAGLAGCTAITIRMVADRKGWPLEGVRVRLRHDKVEPGENGCEARGPGKVDLFRAEVGLEGPLEPEQFRRLMEVAEKCPVHKTLKLGACLQTVELGPES